MSRLLSDLLFRLRALFRRDAARRQLDEELSFHLEMDVADLRARGLDADAARHEARRRFGSARREAEQAGDAWGVTLADEFITDVRHALRQMRRRIGYSSMVILTLALGIGATVSLFSVVNDLLVRPLPYADAERISAFWSDYNWRGEEYDFVRERPGVFASIAAFSTNDAPYRSDASGTAGARDLQFVVATSTIADVLGAHPAVGRWFDATEDRPGAAPVIVISYGMWRDDLGGDPDVLGRRIQIDGAPVTVVGVMPRGFYFPTPNIRAWRPLQIDPSSQMYGVGYLTLVARARPGVGATRVQQDAQRIARDLGTRFRYPQAWDKTKNANAIPLRTYLVGDVRSPLLLLLSAVTLLLGIACANAAALMLARTSDRTGEMALRSALGAGRGRLARQMVSESLVLATAAAVLGAGLATAGFRMLVARLPLTNGFDGLLAPGWPTFVAAFVLALVIALAASATIRKLPGGRLGAASMRERNESGLGRGTRRVHGAIIVSQVSLAVMLMVGATLLIRSVERLRSIDLGLDPAGVTTYTLAASEATPIAAQTEFFRQVVTRASTLPGVTAAGLINRLPLRDGGYQGVVGVEGRPDLAGPNRPNALYRVVTPGFFRAMGIRLLAGRVIDSTDVAGNLPVAVIDEAFARRMWPGQTAIGRHLESGWTGTMRSIAIVGVVHAPRMTTITGDVPFVMFVPRAQQTPNSGGVLVVRSSLATTALMPEVRRLVAELDPQVAVSRVETMDDVVSSALAQPLRLRFILSVFAVLALALGTIGVYGVVSYAVARRRAEFAIRIALGASPQRVRREVLGVGLLPVLGGVVIGLAASAALGGLLRRFLYGLGPTDPGSLGAAAAALLVAGLAAALIPALRAARTSPVEALRSGASHS